MHYHTTYFHSFLHIFHYIDPNHQSMDSSSSSLPIKAIHSFHAGERNLYTRLAFDLYIDPSCSLHLIAFWLWLEEDGNHKNLIHKITSMTNNSLRSAAHMALSFLDALQTNPNPTSTAFHKNAINGIHYYLSNVCYKALTDLHEKAASQSEARRGVEMIGHSLSCVYLSEVNGLLYVPNSEGSSGNEARRYDKSQMIGLKEEVKPWISCFYTEESNIESCIHAKPGGEYRSNIPRDERMLFVTFSNGYPLTEEELYSFFIRNYGEVERVKVEQVGGRRQQPLFAQVSFYSLSTVLAILNGHYKVKFLINGKHLWVRRFVPKRKHKQANGF